MKYCHLSLLAGATLGFAISTQANLIDGSIGGDTYGSPLAVQTVETQFGDNFSELDAAYGQVKGGVLFLVLTGNLENNFNKINIFIDSGAGGENMLTAAANNGGNNPENDNWANNHAGFTFDSGFGADYILIARHNDTQFDLDIATVGGGLGAFSANGNIFSGSGAGINLDIGNGIGVGFDNSNVAGVLGGTAAADQVAAAAVLTGLELAIPLSLIGNPTGDIRITAAIGNGDHNFYSNQFLGGVAAPQGNLGGDGAGTFTGTASGINLNNFAGDQFFTVAIPEPTTFTLLGLGSLALVMVRRQR